MPDLPGTLSLPSWLQGLNPVDAALLAFLLLYGLDGIRRGFVAGALGLAGIVATLYVALIAYLPAADFLRSTFPSLPLPAVVWNLIGFVLVVILAQLVFSIATRLILVALSPLRLVLGPLGVVERVLGFIPGVAHGLIIAALLLVPLHLFPFAQPLTSALDNSVIAGEITRRVTALSPQGEALLRRIAQDGGVFPSRVIQPGDNIRVPRAANVRPDPEAEAKMLALVNAERAKAGLRPLVADERLRQVARQHSQEMFRLGYFSHTSPTDGSPSERLEQSGIDFRTAGENLAYAPTVEIAHSGLMASPGHRRNILTPEFSRVGIGVMRGGLYGRM
ncbi:MAG: CvpA family protein, partial [Chloroflexota bacterium]